MVSKVWEIVLPVLIVIFVIYLLKWVFVDRVQVPILSDVLRKV